MIFYLLANLAQGQTITEMLGVAELQRRADQRWTPTYEGDVLEVGGAVRTFEGELRLDLDGDNYIKLGRDSLLVRTPRGYQLVTGKLYTRTEQEQFFLSAPVTVMGEARLDRFAEAGGRVAVIEGRAETPLADGFELATGEQLFISRQMPPAVETFVEEDPWYRDILSIGDGDGEILAFEGVAEVQPEGETWQPSVLGAPFAPVVRARTAEASWLEIRFDNQNVIRLQADTEILLRQFDRFEDGKTRTAIKLERGKIWAVVIEEDQPFEIETPGLVAGVRGTRFRVDTAENGAPPLIKTFEGKVAGRVGFETVVIEEDQQFDPVAGIEPLEIDAIDLFNIARDIEVIAPPLSLDPLPSSIDSAVLEVSGRVDEGSLVEISGGNALVTGTDFEGSARLLEGFNLIAFSVRYTGRRAVTKVVRPVISTQPQVLLLARAERTGAGVLLRGVTEPAARLSLRGDFGERRLRLNAQGRFRVSLPASTEASSLILEAQLDDGQIGRLELTLSE